MWYTWPGAVDILDPVQLILKLNVIRSVSKQTLLFNDRQTIKLDSHLFVIPSRMNYHDQVQAVFDIIGRDGIMIRRISAALPQTNKNCCWEISTKHKIGIEIAQEELQQSLKHPSPQKRCFSRPFLGWRSLRQLHPWNYSCRHQLESEAPRRRQKAVQWVDA